MKSSKEFLLDVDDGGGGGATDGRGRQRQRTRTDGRADEALLLYHFTKESIRAEKSKTEEGRKEGGQGASVRASERCPPARPTEAHHFTSRRSARALGGNGGWREGRPGSAGRRFVALTALSFISFLLSSYPLSLSLPSLSLLVTERRRRLLPPQNPTYGCAALH